MKKRIAIGAAFLALFLLPLEAVAQPWYFNGQSYIDFKLGAYVPTDGLSNLGYGTGFDGDISIGHYFIPGVLAGELGFEYFETSVRRYGSVSDPFGPFIGEIRDDLWATPLTGTIKVNIPFYGLYAGAGIGAYFVDLHARSYGTTAGGVPVYFDGRDSDTVFGGHLLAGISYPIAPNFSIAAEGKYIFTGKASFFGLPYSRLDGATATANLRFTF